MTPSPDRHNLYTSYRTSDRLDTDVRREQLRRHIGKLDKMVDNLRPERAVPPIGVQVSHGLVAGQGKLQSWFSEGRVVNTTLLPPHEHFTPDDKPGTVVFAQFLRLRVDLGHMGSRWGRPVATHYLLSLWGDLIANHAGGSPNNAAPFASGPVTADPRRTKLVPPAETFTSGVSSYDNTVRAYQLDSPSGYDSPYRDRDHEDPDGDYPGDALGHFLVPSGLIATETPLPLEVYGEWDQELAAAFKAARPEAIAYRQKQATLPGLISRLGHALLGSVH